MTTLPQAAPVRLPRAVMPSHLAPSGPMVPGFAPPAAAAAGITGGDVWRVLRANAWLIAVMVMASAVAGYFVNTYLAQHYSRYTARGLLEVRLPNEVPMPGREAAEAGPADIALAQMTQKAILEHETTFVQAIEKSESKIRETEWFRRIQAEKGNDWLAAAKKSMALNFDASPVPNSRLLQVSMTYSNPDDAKMIVEEMVNQHIRVTKQNQTDVEQKKVALLDNELKLVVNELASTRTQLVAKEQLLGVDQVGTSMMWSGQQLQLERLMASQNQVESELSGYVTQLKSLDADLGNGQVPVEIEDRIGGEGEYAGLRLSLNAMKVQLAVFTAQYGAQNEIVIRQKMMQAEVQEQLNQHREELKSRYTEYMRGRLGDAIAAMQSNSTRIDDAIKRISARLAYLNQVMTEYRRLQREEDDWRLKKNTLDEEIRKIRQLRIATPWSTATWASQPQKPDRPSFPRLEVTLAASVLLGLGLSLGIAFLREMTDTTVRSPQDLAKVGQLNLLGMIPHEADDPQAADARLHLAIFDAPNSMVAEQFRHVRTKLQHMSSLDTARTILVTSPSPGDGKSMVACNLAAALALNGRRVLLVDANFRRPTLHTLLGFENAAGLADVLNNPELLDQTARETDVPNLLVLPSGTRPSNPTELLESQLFVDFVERAMEEFDHVVFDSGPLLMVSDTVALAPRVDGVVTVVRARGNSRGLLMRMRDELRKVKAEHLGVVLNAVRSQGGGYYGRNIKTYYAYQNA